MKITEQSTHIQYTTQIICAHLSVYVSRIYRYMQTILTQKMNYFIITTLLCSIIKNPLIHVNEINNYSLCALYLQLCVHLAMYSPLQNETSERTYDL